MTRAQILTGRAQTKRCHLE